MMMEPSTLPARGRPRSERSKQAILTAAGELLSEQGLRQMSIESVAERASVSKTTIYRWWPSKGVLALDAFYQQWAASQGMTPDTGSLRGDLTIRLRAVASLMRSETFGQTLAELIAETHADPGLAEAYREHVQEPLREQSRTIFKRARERGEIPADTDLELAIDLVYGPLFYRLLDRRQPPTRKAIDTLLELALTGITSSTPNRP